MSIQIAKKKSRSLKIYQLNTSTIAMLKGKGYTNLECKKCGVEIKEGEDICSKSTGSCGLKRKFYHPKCAEKVNIL